MNLNRVFFVCLFVTYLNTLQSQNTIVFTYNAGGGLTERKLQVQQQGARLNWGSNVVDSTMVDNLKVYPNPASTHLTIEGPMPVDSKTGRISFLNAGGQIVKSDTYLGELKTITVNDLANGIYFMEIEFSRKDRKSYKIIITH